MKGTAGVWCTGSIALNGGPAVIVQGSPEEVRAHLVRLLDQMPTLRLSDHMVIAGPPAVVMGACARAAVDGPSC